MGITPKTTEMRLNMDDTPMTEPTVIDTKVETTIVTEIKYTNKQAEVLKATCINKLGEFDNSKWETLKTTLVANGAVFPLNNRSSIVSTTAINKVDDAVMASFKSNFEHLSPQGRKGYTLDGEGRLVEISLLCRIIEPNKNQWTKKRFDTVMTSINTALKTTTKS